MQVDPITQPGLCQCGCGRKTRLAPYTCASRRQIKGVPLRFLHGHNGNVSLDHYDVEDRGYKTPCWIWRGAKLTNGYGFWTPNGQRVLTHRASYERRFGKTPLPLDHLCRVPSCINPDHLEAVTQAVNVQRGAAAKLTKENVLEIRRLHHVVRQRDLARHYGVSLSTIKSIHQRSTWKNLPLG